MTFFLLLIAVMAERFLDLQSLLHRFSWFDAALDSFYAKLNRYGRIATLTILLLLLPITVLVVYLILASFFFNVFGFLFALAVLCYCLGPIAMYAQLETYLHARIRGEDLATIQHYGQHLLSTEQVASLAACDETISKNLYIELNRRIVAVVFWFLVFGPFAAVFYRLVCILHDNARQGRTMATELSTLDFMLQLLDWIPVRIISLFYSVCGNMKESFAVWKKYVLTGLHNNQRILVETGCTAIRWQATEDAEKSLHYLQDTRAVLDKALLYYLLLLLIFVFIFI